MRDEVRKLCGTCETEQVVSMLCECCPECGNLLEEIS